jgi:uncharacterized protein (TIGR00730 family)
MAAVKSLCVYCGSSIDVRETHREAARTLGSALASAGIRLVYGGGQIGLMGLIADAALAAGGTVTGIIPKFLDQLEIGHTGCTEFIVTENMHDRKLKMASMADAFVTLPGGFGTLDETFEILTWKQLRLHDKPIVIADIDGYWTPLLALMANQFEENYVRPEHRDLFRVAPDVASILPILAAEPEPRFSLEKSWF